VVAAAGDAVLVEVVSDPEDLSDLVCRADGAHCGGNGELHRRCVRRRGRAAPVPDHQQVQLARRAAREQQRRNGGGGGARRHLQVRGDEEEILILVA
jgi:hypothetical protein